jgi:predicted GNAT family acetyltransferase
MGEPGDAPTTRAAALVAELSAQQRILAAAQARHAALMVEFGLVRRGLDDHRIADRAAEGIEPCYRPGEFAAMEIGLATTTSRHSVQRTVAMAQRLRQETPDVWDAWLAGDIDQLKTTRINHALLRLSHDYSKQLLNAMVVPVAACKTAELLGRWLNQFVARVEPLETDERMRRSFADRYASLRPDLDGISFLSAALSSMAVSEPEARSGGHDAGWHLHQPHLRGGGLPMRPRPHRARPGRPDHGRQHRPEVSLRPPRQDPCGPPDRRRRPTAHVDLDHAHRTHLPDSRRPTAGGELAGPGPARRTTRAEEPMRIDTSTGSRLCHHLSMVETGGEHLIEHLTDQGRFRLTVDGEEAAVLDYVGTPGTWDITHTYSDPKFRGSGAASELVQRVFDDARAAGLRIVPSCPYIPVWLSRHLGEADLVDSAR